MLMDKAKQKHNNTRAPKTTRTQYGIMVDALEKNSQINWEELTGKLNAASHGTGPRRTASGWRRVFSEWKCNVKKKARNVTEEGFHQLSTLELRLLKDQSIVDEQELSKIKEHVRENKREPVRENISQSIDQKDVTKRAPKTKPKQYEIMLRALQLDDMNWENLTNTLNSVAGGPTKTPEGWRRVFTEWKCNVKKRAKKSKGDPNFLSETDKQLLLAIGVTLNTKMAEPFELAFPSDNSSISSSTDDIFKIKGEPFEEDVSIEENDFESLAAESADRKVIVEDFINFGANTSNENFIPQNLNLSNSDELMKKVDKINTNLEAINSTLIQLTGVLSKLVEKS